MNCQRLSCSINRAGQCRIEYCDGIVPQFWQWWRSAWLRDRQIGHSYMMLYLSNLVYSPPKRLPSSYCRTAITYHHSTSLVSGAETPWYIFLLIWWTSIISQHINRKPAGTFYNKRILFSHILSCHSLVIERNANISERLSLVNTHNLVTLHPMSHHSLWMFDGLPVRNINLSLKREI